MQELVRRWCPDTSALSDREVADVAGACGGSPLLARVVAVACGSGYLTVQVSLQLSVHRRIICRESHVELAQCMRFLH